MATHSKQRKICNKCGEPGLAWSRTAEGFRLFKGHMVNGKWEADLTQRHQCNGSSGSEQSDQSEDRGAPDVVRLACGCGFSLTGTKADVLKYGYPICGTCEDFMVAGDVVVKRAAELTPEEVTV